MFTEREYVWFGLAALCVFTSVVMATASQPQWWVPLAVYCAAGLLALAAHKLSR